MATGRTRKIATTNKLPRRKQRGIKVVLRESSENEALQAAVTMRKGKVVDLTSPLVIAASRLSFAHHLPMAESIILTTAREFAATIWTQNSDFKGMDNVKVFPKT